MSVAGPIGWRVVTAPAHWLERARGRRRLALLMLYGLVLLGLGSVVYRQSRLAGLPDIGDPFDTAPLRNFRLPDEENSFVLTREALAKSRHDRAIELRILVAKFEPRLFVGSTVKRLSPVPVPKRLLYGPRAERSHRAS